MLSRLAALLRLFRWRTVYRPGPVPKGVIIVYPHTSNWDFAVACCSGFYGVPIRWAAKDSFSRSVACCCDSASADQPAQPGRSDRPFAITNKMTIGTANKITINKLSCKRGIFNKVITYPPIAFRQNLK